MMDRAADVACWLWFPLAFFAFWRGARTGLNKTCGRVASIIGSAAAGAILSLAAFCVLMAFITLAGG